MFVRFSVALLCAALLCLCACQQQPIENEASESTIPEPQEPLRANQSGRNFLPPNYVFEPDIPHDIVTQNVGAIGFQPFVDNLGWQTFIALNWPAPQPITERGVPDRQNVIGGFKQSGEGGGSTSPTGPTVWETYKNTFDIFLNPPDAPASFNAGPIIPSDCGDQTATNVLYEYLQAFTGKPLIDQNGEKVWYQVNVNQVYFDYIVDNQFYVSTNQKGATIAFPYSSNTTSTLATVKVKAAWKVMGGAGSKQPDDPSRFYTSEALLYDPATKTCRRELMGLVGMHVVVKTAQLPQWMWATFEHVDNAPDKDSGPVAGTQYNFYNSACTDCPVNQPPDSITSTTPTQVMRVVPVDVTAPNAVFQEALKDLRSDNVWQYYEMVNTQWGASPTPLGQPNQPKYLANTTMETYLQDPVDDPSAPHGCINCHGTFAGNTDLDFQMERAYPHSTTFAERFLTNRSNSIPKD